MELYFIFLSFEMESLKEMHNFTYSFLAKEKEITTTVEAFNTLRS